MAFWEILRTLGIISIGSFSIVALLGYLTKTLFSKYIQAKTDAYKHTLEVIAIEHEIRFNELHKERAQIIKDIYSKILDFKISVSNFIRYVEAESTPDATRALRFIEDKTVALALTYEPNRIYFSNKLCIQIDNLFVEVKSLNINLTSLLKDNSIAEILSDKNNLKLDFMQLAENTTVLITTKIDPIKNELEMEFRKLLGVRED